MTKVIIKFKDASVQPAKLDDPEANPVRRVVGFVELKNIFTLFDNATLTANPRRAKKNRVVLDILDTLENSPDLFRYKSKGLLLSSDDVDILERNRFRVGFSDSPSEGILDGGHNMFAIGCYVLSHVLEEKEIRRIRNWDQLKDAWDANAEPVHNIIDEIQQADVAVELLFPSSDNDDVKKAFELALFEISQARNNNAQVTDEAFQNQLGLYDPIKRYLPPVLSRRVEWKPGEVSDDTGGKVINPKDIVSLAWIPLNVLNEANLLPTSVSVSPQNIYRNKGECSDKFGNLMKRDDVTTPVGGKVGQTRQLTNPTVESAIEVLGMIPELVDLIYEEFPTAYNAGGYNFGRRKQVKMYKPDELKILKASGKDHSGYTATRPSTPFYGRSSKKMIHKYPEAFIMPFVTALSVLMEVKNDRIQWISGDMQALVHDKLMQAAPLYDSMLDAHNWDPQALAKNHSVHRFAAQLFKM